MLITALRCGARQISSPLADPAHPVRQLEAVGNKIAQNAVHTAPTGEHVKNELDRVAHPLIGIEHDLAGDAAQIAAREREAEFSARRLVTAALVEPGAHDVEF